MTNTAILIVFGSFFMMISVRFGHSSPPQQQNVTENETALINEQEIKRITRFAIEWCHNNGLITARMESKGRSDLSGFPPITLFPSPFPRIAFEQALNVQKAMNLLYFRVASDFDFLMDAYKDVIESDKLIGKLVDLLKEVHEEGIRQPITLMFQRADYLLNVVENNETSEEKYELKQVEVNTGAIDGTGLKRRTTELHRRMVEKAGMDASKLRMPDNEPDAAKVEALYKAWLLFKDPTALVLFLLYEDTPFKYDFLYIEEELHKISGGKLKVERYLLVDQSENLSHTKRLQLDPENLSLRLDGRKVAVAYSSITTLGCKLDEHALELQRIIERSTAIKAPSMFVALTSSRKVQQILAMPGKIERFFPATEDAETVAQIRATFAAHWGLEKEDEKTQKLIKDAIANPGNFVLKPNRECGGNTFYDEKLVEKLRGFSPSERAAHILMQKLRPMAVKNFVVKEREEAKQADVIPELGVYGFLIGNLKDGRVLHNVQQGYHLRTCLSTGYGYTDTAYLY